MPLEDLTAFADFPERHWKKIQPASPLEQVNREIKRRVDVVQHDLAQNPGRSRLRWERDEPPTAWIEATRKHAGRVNDFCEGGSLAVAGGADVAAAITELIGQAPAGYRHVVATRDLHIAPGGHFADNPDFVHSWPAHCVAGTEGVGFHPNFAPAVASGAVDAVFDKGAYAAAYSGFEGADENGVALGDWLRAREIDEVDVVGIATDHCVRATALDSVRNGFRTQVLLDLTAGVSEETTDRALEELRAAGVDLTGKPVV